MDRRGAASLIHPRQDAHDSEVRELRDSLRFMRRVVCEADEGLITPDEALRLVLAEAIRALGDGPPVRETVGRRR